MGFLDRFRHKEEVVPLPEPLPEKEAIFPTPIDGLFLPVGCSREGDTIIVGREYTALWLEKYPDKIEAVKQMLVFLKSQYPAISKFKIEK